MSLNEIGTQEAQLYLVEDTELNFEYVEFEVIMTYQVETSSRLLERKF